ncbi:MAG: putative metal-binding motif-containing protein, partial [Bacteroidota bacterium]
PFNVGNAKAITSQWQIAKESDFNRKLYKDLLIHHLTEFRGVREEGVDLSTIEIAGLEKEENYFWRMRYRNSDLMWSDWSRPKSFYLKEGNNELSENLVFNPDAEMGPDGWSGDIEHLKYGRCNTGRAYEGLSHFSAGGVCLNELDTSYAYQDIPLSMFPNGVQSNSIVAELSAYLRNFNGADIAEMYLEFYNTYGDYIQQSNVLSHNTPYWTLKSDVIKIPEGTASCRIILRGIRISGKSNDAYFDNLSLKISNAENCFVCVGNSNIDNDNDGFCSDQDCNDDDPSFYPGANEICDQKDNDCDGYADNGNIVQWTGAGVNNLWSNLRNWSQNELPLPCQKVIINTKDSIIVDGNMICKNLEIGEESILLINPNAQLTLTEKINMPVIYNKGTMLVNGSCTIHTNADGAIKLSGDLFVKGQINSKVVIEEQLEILGKGQYKNFQYSN